MFNSVSLFSQAPLARGSRALPSVLFGKWLIPEVWRLKIHQTSCCVVFLLASEVKPHVCAILIAIKLVCRIAGYDENSCEQPWSVDLTFKLLMVVPSILSILVSLVFLWLYPITKSSIARTTELLSEQR